MDEMERLFSQIRALWMATLETEAPVGKVLLPVEITEEMESDFANHFPKDVHGKPSLYEAGILGGLCRVFDGIRERAEKDSFDTVE